MRVLPDAVRNYLAWGYGGKRAFLAAMWHTGWASIGAFNSYRQVRWREVSRIVFVCKGNICRSPYAEHKFRAWGAKAVSAGLLADAGKPAALPAQQAARRRGIDLAVHRAQALSALSLTAGDLLVAFEPGHAKTLSALARKQAGVQVTLLALWSPNPRLVYLHDPYGLSENYFERCYQRIDWGLTGMFERISGAKPATGNR